MSTCRSCGTGGVRTDMNDLCEICAGDDLLREIEHARAQAVRGISYVGDANYAHREREAKGWVQEAFNRLSRVAHDKITELRRKDASFTNLGLDVRRAMHGVPTLHAYPVVEELEAEIRHLRQQADRLVREYSAPKAQTPDTGAVLHGSGAPRHPASPQEAANQLLGRSRKGTDAGVLHRRTP